MAVPSTHFCGGSLEPDVAFLSSFGTAMPSTIETMAAQMSRIRVKSESASLQYDKKLLVGAGGRTLSPKVSRRHLRSASVAGGPRSTSVRRPRATPARPPSSA
eukprot:Amastigsp_a3753_4.p4 type:complete len:103 gc:universal Amastigsp_a3753_4:523-831(+)